MQEIPPKDHHRPIPHDADDKSAILQQAGGIGEQGDKEIGFFEK
ncbi:MAG: hypothetical protein AAF171_21640 [Cyanobacteria bacterium P01_A01_bin.116]